MRLKNKAPILDLPNLSKSNGRKLRRRILVNLKQEYYKHCNNWVIIQQMHYLIRIFRLKSNQSNKRVSKLKLRKWK